MSRYSWTIIPNPEKTQSNTYGPLLALGIDGARVTFPDRWINDVFIKNLFPGLPFKNLDEFREYIKGEITRNFRNSSLQTFLEHCDNKGALHLPGNIQETILYSTPRNDMIETFFGYIVANTKRNFAGKQMIVEFSASPSASATPAVTPAISPEGGITQTTPAVKPSTGSWSCKICTFTNPANVTKCQVCYGEKTGGRRKLTRKRSRAKKVKTLRKKVRRRG